MIAAGYTVPPDVEARLVERMREGAFTHAELDAVAARLMVPKGDISHRTADRLIQRERKRGHIHWTYESGRIVWSWRHPAASPAGREG